MCVAACAVKVIVAGAWMEVKSESSPTGQTHLLSLTWFLVQTSFYTIYFDCVTLVSKHETGFMGSWSLQR